MSNFSFSHSVFERLVLLLILYQMTKILHCPELEALAVDKIFHVENMNGLGVRVEKMGKGEKAGYQHFLLFP